MGNTNSEIKLFSGRGSHYLSEKIAKASGIDLGKIEFRKFSDGEFEIAYDESVRGAHVFVIQSTNPPAENLMELLFLIDAAKRASAYKIIAVIPYFGFARQDRKDKPRCSIGAKLVANLLTAAGVDRIVTLDLHADQIQGFFDVPVDHLYASAIFVPYLRSLKLDNLVVAAPDMGGAKRANSYANFLQTGLVVSHKVRKAVNVVGDMTVIGDVENKNVVIIDDMIDTAGTITKSAEIMMDRGAKSVRVVATHPVLSGPAYDRINASKITELVVSDSIPIKPLSDKIKVLSISSVFADVIHSVYEHRSISTNFILKS
ncbi:MAG: ribose-phosphate pyrophosphokinase [Bacteroidota bacterium]|nr:ribose-phosphate pyrophosphokinase [Bacteroidota bacterium]